MKKQYSDFTEVEQHIIREYESWKNSKGNIKLKLANLEYWMGRAIEKNIQHILTD